MQCGTLYKEMYYFCFKYPEEQRNKIMKLYWSRILWVDGNVRGCVKLAYDIDSMPLKQFKIVSQHFWYQQILYRCPMNLFNIGFVMKPEMYTPIQS